MFCNVGPKTMSAVRVAALASCSVLAFHGVAEAASKRPVTTAPEPTPTTTAGGGATAPSTTVVTPSFGTVAAQYGDIDPAYGRLRPFYGKLRPFYGTLRPFYGKLRPFYGRLRPFTAGEVSAMSGLYGTPGGREATDAFWGPNTKNPEVKSPSEWVLYADIDDFWDATGKNWDSFQAEWDAAQNPNDFSAVAAKLDSLILNPASSFWGAAVTGGFPLGSTATFRSGFLDSFLAKSGITLNADGTVNAASLQNLSQTDRAMFFLSFYDNLMTFSGAPHLDYWMGSTGWSPALAGVAATVTNATVPITIGMIDFTVSPTTGETHKKGTVLQYGANVFDNGHGAAIGSLLVGSTDGSRILGVMPAGSAKVVAYNPYDATGTTNWADVGVGIDTLVALMAPTKSNAPPVGVLNASLGVPGWTLHPGWNEALASGRAKNKVLVVAAGNDGVAQTENVPWNFKANPTLLIVGSIGYDGSISNFSNTPGEACLLDTLTSATACTEANKLKYRFIVAPGELVLVSDGRGGVTRQTGTSLAAPLVAGAVGLLQARWPWLANYSEETAQIILKSATPMGDNPGADAVYGVGALNIAASQRPLSWTNMVYFKPPPFGKAGATKQVSLASVVTTIKGGAWTSWNKTGLYFTAKETIGRTYRDFKLPFDRSLVGQTISGQLFQDYLAVDMQAMAASGALGFNQRGDTDPATLGFIRSSVPIGEIAGMDLRMRVSPTQTRLGYRDDGDAYTTEMALVGKNQTLQFGSGDGALALDGPSSFRMRSDYDATAGGANPVLGLASGGGYVAWRVGVTDQLSFRAGATQRHSVRDTMQFGLPQRGTAAAVYEASAQTVGADYRVNDGLVVYGSYTQLQEDSALLGVQSLDEGSLSRGSATRAVTLGMDAALPSRFALSGSVTMARTKAEAGQNLSTGDDGIQSSAAQISLSRSGVVTKSDQLRLSLIKPMQVDGGEIKYRSWDVIDRDTGEWGLVGQTTSAAGDRVPVSVELIYSSALPDQGGNFSLFARASANTDTSPDAAPVNYLFGGAYKIGF